MPRRSVAVPLALVLALVALGLGACKRSDQKSTAASGSGRPLSQVWADMLGQRDVIHIVFMKELEDVTHQDCADVGSAARKLDELTGELMNSLGATSTPDDGRMRATGNSISRMSSVVSKIREMALAESPGAFPELRFPLDYALRDLEQRFSPDQLGGESVTSRPGYETQPLPAPISPI